jgi:hypothetical protein
MFTLFKKKESIYDDELITENKRLLDENLNLKETIAILHEEFNENNKQLDEKYALKEQIHSLQNQIMMLEQNNPLLCPITHEIDINNMVISEKDGRCYNKIAIREWLTKKSISPITNEKMDNSDLHDITSIYSHIIKMHKCINQTHTKYMEIIDTLLTKKTSFKTPCIENKITPSGVFPSDSPPVMD